jgi:hypothetical protein
MSTVQAEFAAELAQTKCAEFVAAFTVRAAAVTSQRASQVCELVHKDQAEELLADLARSLAGQDWIDEDEEFEDICAEAGIDYQETMRPEPRPGSEADLAKKELGDLGELIALLHALCHVGHAPRCVLAKNALKLSERKSESGIDVLCFALDLDSDEVGGLLASDKVTLVESKAGRKRTFRALALEAAEYFDSMTLHQWQRELMLAQASPASRGAGAAAKRIKHLLLVFPSGDQIRRLAFLVSDRSIAEPVDLDPLDAVSGATATLLSLDLDAVCGTTFEYRRRDG